MFIFTGYAFLCLFLREWRLYFENDSIAAFITDTADFTECLFAGTEMAVVSLNTAKLHKLEEEGNPHAVKLLKLVADPSGFLSTIQIGITLAGYLGSALASENFAGYFVHWIYYDLHFTLWPENMLTGIAIVLITMILAFLP